PTEVAYADVSCNFRFLRVSPGTYFIHIDIDGYEEFRARVDVGENGMPGSSLIQLVPAPGRHTARGLRNRTNGPDAVDISEPMDQYPHKAVNLYDKAVDSHRKGKNAQAIEQLEQAIKIAP